MSTIFIAYEGQARPEISQLHVNLWVLDGIFGRSVLYLDVGIAYIACEEGELQLHLPVSVTDNYVKDLESKCRQDLVRHALFSTALDIESQSIKYCDKQFSFTPTTPSIRAHNAKPLYTEIRLPTLPPDSGNDGRYARFRLRIRNSQRLFAWDRFPLLRTKSFARVDLRVNDLRGVADYEEIRHHEQHIVPVQQLRFFLIAPPRLIPRLSNPDLHYVRLFEWRVWHDYLNRAPSLLPQNSHRFAVYQWKSESTVGLQSPFRCFSAMETLRLGTMHYVKLGVIVSIAIVVIDSAATGSIAEMAVWTWTSAQSMSLAEVSVLGVILTAISFLFGLLGWTLRAVPNSVRRWARRTENLIYKVAGQCARKD